MNAAQYNYPGIYQEQNFHHCGLEPGDDLVDFYSRAEVQTCELLGLPEYVFQSIILVILVDHLGSQLSHGHGIRTRATCHIRQRLAVSGCGRIPTRRCKT